MIKSLVGVAVATLLTCSIAGAAPATSSLPKTPNAEAAAPGVTEAQYRKGRKYRGNRKYRRNFRRGRSYRGRSYYRGRNYSGYRRYGSRPYGWRSRGCFVVGPVWFCP